MAIREGRWDCDSCGSTGIYGRHVECPGCGRPRPARVRFYLTDDAPVVVDPERLAEARAGADWICARCTATNRATLAECGGCGAPRGASATQPVTVRSLEDAYSPAAPSDAPAPVGPAKSASPVTVPLLVSLRQSLRSLRRGDYLVAGLLGVLFTPVVWAAVLEERRNREPQPGVVEDREWTRYVDTEQLVHQERSGWELPPSAELRYTVQAEKYTRSILQGYDTVQRRVASVARVQDGYVDVEEEYSEEVQTGTDSYVCGQRDLGNGYFEDVMCDEPVYETRTRTRTRREPRFREDTTYRTVEEVVPLYTYEPVYAPYHYYVAPEWQRGEQQRATSRTGPPEWPRLPGDSAHRERKRWEEGWMQLRTASGERILLPLRLETWDSFPPGKRVAYRRRGPDGIEVLPADSLPACRRWHRGRGGPPPDSLGCSPRRAASP